MKLRSVSYEWGNFVMWGGKLRCKSLCSNLSMQIVSNTVSKSRNTNPVWFSCLLRLSTVFSISVSGCNVKCCSSIPYCVSIYVYFVASDVFVDMFESYI